MDDDMQAYREKIKAISARLDAILEDPLDADAVWPQMLECVAPLEYHVKFRPLIAAVERLMIRQRRMLREWEWGKPDSTAQAERTDRLGEIVDRLNERLLLSINTVREEWSPLRSRE